jgi:enoyl-CoA hydratase
MSEPSQVLVERNSGVAVVTINRADKLNALNEQLLAELTQTFVALGKDAAVRVAILTGAGKAFVAGADIAAMSGLSPLEAQSFSRAGHELGYIIEDLPIPVIAAVNGYALGGGLELALCADFIIASQRAKFGQPEVGLGLIPGFGGTQRLPRRIGIARARELIYSGDTIDAEEAARIGLVNRIVAPEELIERATDLASRIASRSTVAVASCKRLLQEGQAAPLRTANELEVNAFAALFGSEDQREGTQAFLERRSPTFAGRRS